jgi:signal transduction histidine kinase
VFQNLTIKKKLIGIILLVSVLSLIIGFSLVVLYELRAAKVKFVDDIRFHARLTGEYCREALISKDKESLEAALSKFCAIPYITDSVIFDSEGKPLAVYSHPGDGFVPPALVQIKPYEYSKGYLSVILPIVDKDLTYGKIFVRASANEVNKKFIPFLISIILLFGGLAVLVFFLAQMLQNIISKPVMDMVSATKKISGPSESGAKVKKRGKNELKVLRQRLGYLLEQVDIREMNIDKVEKAQKNVLELEKSVDLYRERFENIAYGIAVFEAVEKGQDFIIKDFNSTAEKLEMIHRADLIGMRVTAVFPGVRSSGLIDVFQKVWQNDTVEYIPFSRFRDDDKAGWREFFISKLPSGEISAAFRDVTEQKLAEEALKKENEEEQIKLREEQKTREEQKSKEFNKTAPKEALNNELEGLFFTVANNLGEPLNGISEFSMSLLQNYADKVDDEGKNQLIQIRAASHRMNQLFKEIEQLTRLSFVELKLGQVDLSALVSKKSVELKEGNPDRKADFVIKEGVNVRGDARLLGLVIDNLLTNAWIYSSKKPKIKIEFGIKENKKIKEFFIKDNGVGFEMKHVEAMFRPFKKLNPDELYPGTGMGLAIVRRIIHKHGGIIRAEGKPGKGAVFYFTLGT